MSEENKVVEGQKSKDVSISWHSMTNTDVLQQLETPEETGLSNAEIKARKEKYGPNELTEAPQLPFGNYCGLRSTVS